MYPYSMSPPVQSAMPPMYSAMVGPQQRLAMMEQQQYQQFPQMQQGFQQPQGQQTAPVLKGRPVSSYEEANAAMIDLDGSVFYFIDQAHKAIYTKQIGLDGAAILKVYNLAEQGAATTANTSPQPSEPPVMRSEFNQAVTTLQAQINAVADKIKEGVVRNEPDANDGDAKRKK